MSFLTKDGLPSYEATETITKYKGVKRNATTPEKVDAIDTAGESGLGVAYDGGGAGTAIPVALHIGDGGYGLCGGTVTAKDPCQFDADGEMVTQATGRIVSRCIKGGSSGKVGLFEWLGNAPDSLKGLGAAVASAAGVVTPTARFQHVTGALAITGITATGFQDGDEWTVIPDGAFTWTTATNIAVAGTAVVNRTLKFKWDATAVKWNPSYV